MAGVRSLRAALGSKRGASVKAPKTRLTSTSGVDRSGPGAPDALETTHASSAMVPAGTRGLPPTSGSALGSVRLANCRASAPTAWPSLRPRSWGHVCPLVCRRRASSRTKLPSGLCSRMRSRTRRLLQPQRFRRTNCLGQQKGPCRCPADPERCCPSQAESSWLTSAPLQAQLTSTTLCYHAGKQNRPTLRPRFCSHCRKEGCGTQLCRCCWAP